MGNTLRVSNIGRVTKVVSNKHESMRPLHVSDTGVSLSYVKTELIILYTSARRSTQSLLSLPKMKFLINNIWAIFFREIKVITVEDKTFF